MSLIFREIGMYEFPWELMHTENVLLDVYLFILC